MNVVNIPIYNTTSVVIKAGKISKEIRIPTYDKIGALDILTISLSTNLSSVERQAFGLKVEESCVVDSVLVLDNDCIEVYAENGHCISLSIQGVFSIHMLVYRRALSFGMERNVITVVFLVSNSEIHLQEESGVGGAISTRVFSCSSHGFVICNRKEIELYAKSLRSSNLISQFTSTEDGAVLMRQGYIMPVLGIHAWSYRVVVSDVLALPDCVQNFGRSVIEGRLYNLVGSGALNEMCVYDAQWLSNWSEKIELCDPIYIRGGSYRLDVYASGSHGSDWLPTYLFCRIGDSAKNISAPLINEDPCDAFEHMSNSEFSLG